LNAGDFVTVADPPSPTDTILTLSLSTTPEGTVFGKPATGGSGNNGVPEPGTLALSVLALAGLAVKVARS
jgi:hypothetical protein